jgi:hypothetical protein
MATPTKLPPTVRYAEAEYWESRYQREPAVFEWFFGHTALRRIIRVYISKKQPVLHLGCGTSNLQEGMAKSGYTVVNVSPDHACCCWTRFLRLALCFSLQAWILPYACYSAVS